MKTLTALLCALLLAAQVFAQRTPENWRPKIITPTPHDPNFKSRLKNTEVKSFYKSKADWQLIIDTTWGPGLPLEEKLKIFNTFTDSLTRKFDGFNSLGINETEWDSVKSAYRSKINASTSRGAFSSLMSHLAYGLKDCHTYAEDSSVVSSPLNPGTPVLLIDGFTCAHFGAVLTTLPDSSLVVLRTLEDHPLGLEPGDLVLGYEGIPWKILIDELLASDIPLLTCPRGAKSALRHGQLLSAGVNWHLFDTIDIVKYNSGDTLHLSVYPLLDLPIPVGWISDPGEKKNLFVNNEQLPVPGVPFPDPNETNERAVFYGIVEGTNIGYVYLIIDNLYGFSYTTGEQLFEAVTDLWNTDGLIIDIRWEGGGWPWSTAYELLFNEQFYTIEDAYRCSPEDFLLYSDNDPDEFKIPGKPMTIYDRPLAVLTGANAGSGGDIRAQWMTYHPMAAFFGMSTMASMGDNESNKNFPDWWLHYSKSDMFHVSRPGVYLNRREFPVDDSTWFDRDGVANGEDAVVNKAIEWIRNLSHAHDVKVQPVFTKLANAEITLTAEVENPNNHTLLVYAKIADRDKVPVDSIPLYDDGGHGDGNAGDGTWGAKWSVPSGEKVYAVNITTKDTAAGSLRTLPRVVQFTTSGPVVFFGITWDDKDTIPNPGDNLYFKITLKNNGLSASAVNIRAQLTSLDTLLALVPVSSNNRPFADIAPGELSTNSNFYRITISEYCPVNTEIPVKTDILCDDYQFWSDTFSILVREPAGLEDINEPMTRIYPNPTDNILNIEISNTGQQGLEIEILTITGEILYQKEYKNVTVQFAEQIDLSGYTKGIYLLKVKQDNGIYVGKVVVR